MRSLGYEKIVVDQSLQNNGSDDRGGGKGKEKTVRGKIGKKGDVRSTT